MLQMRDKHTTKQQEEESSRRLNERANTWEVFSTNIAFLPIKLEAFFSEDTQNTTHSRENKIWVTYNSFLERRRQPFLRSSACQTPSLYPRSGKPKPSPLRPAWAETQQP